uniref:Phosphotyrosine protein phosphatase domain-containing protein n=1 Tax=Aegilops tauschii subsp. strangulata TaxID=200361 RepID=A0A452XUG7_AEGTS
IQSVTLGDEEAKKRKVQKTILERKGPPTFSCAVEMVSKTECRVHHKLESTVDAILAGKPPKFEARMMDSKITESGGSLVISERVSETERLPAYHQDLVTRAVTSEDKFIDDFGSSRQAKSKNIPSDDNVNGDFGCTKKTKGKQYVSGRPPVRVYTYQVSEADILQVATVMGFEDELDITDDIEAANVILASSSEMKQNPWIRNVAKYHKLPIFVVKVIS